MMRNTQQSWDHFEWVLTDIPSISPGKDGHSIVVYIPYSFRTVVWVLLRPTRTRWVKVLWDGIYGFSSLSKTRKSNRLQMSLQRQYFPLSYFKTPSVGPAGVWTRDPPAQKTGALPTDLTRHRLIIPVKGVKKFTLFECHESTNWRHYFYVSTGDETAILRGHPSHAKV